MGDLYTLCVFEHVSNFKKSENKKLTLVAVFQRGLGVGGGMGQSGSRSVAIIQVTEDSGSAQTGHSR